MTHITKQFFLQAISICFSVLFLFSCSKDDDEIEKIDLQEEGIVDQTFKFEKTIKLYDGNFFVDYTIKADNEDFINHIISLDPQIKVEKFDEKDFQETTDSEFTESVVEKKILISEAITNSNIPKGYKLSFWYGNLKEKNHSYFSKSSYATREFTNSGATGIYVKQNGYQLTCTFYSKGCCWYSLPWYDRGYRTIGPSHTTSYTFNALSHSPYNGAKMTAYTTIEAWNATIKNFLY